MRTYLEYYKILSMWDTQLYSIEEISLITGFDTQLIESCLQEFNSLLHLEEIHKSEGRVNLLYCLQTTYGNEQVKEAYAYILGMYLGDGAISKMNRVYRIRIALDSKYPKIIEACVHALQMLLPDNQVGVVNRGTWKVVSCYYKYWHTVFPQDGDGKKHDRPIILEAWQQAIVDKYPLEFFRGLYHSDGSRSQNIVKGKNYPRYMFCNHSDDIRKLFTDTAEKLGLSWTTANARNVAISKREDVAWLDEHIGAKA